MRLFLAVLAIIVFAVPSLSRAQQTVLLNGEAPGEFTKSVDAAGYRVAVSDGHWPDSAQVAVIETECNFGPPVEHTAPPEDQRKDAAAQKQWETSIAGILADAPARLREGKTLIISLGRRTESVIHAQSLLPVNSWSFEDRQFLRGDSGALATPDSLFNDLPLSGFNVSAHYDLHLPYAAIEAGEHRYRFQDYGEAKNSGDVDFPSMQKELLNTDFSSLLTSDQSGRLPLLVSGRFHAGRVIVFAANLYDPALVRWGQYGAFVSHLLATSPKPAAVESPADAVAKLQLTIPVVQTRVAGEAKPVIRVNVNNATDQPIHAILACKICNAEHELLNSASQPITVNAKQSLSVELPERTAQLGDPTIVPSEDAAAFRIVDVGVCATDSENIAATAHAVIDISPPITLKVSTADYRSFDDLLSFPDRDMGRGYDVAGAAAIDRVAYATGSSPQLTIRLTNARHNIAPLATPSDVDHADNVTAQGLNDLAFSNGSLRGLWPLYGGWYSIVAPQQHVRLQFPMPVTIAASEIDGYGKFREWNKSNPSDFEMTAHQASGDVNLVSVKDADYSGELHRDEFKPTQADACDLKISDIHTEPRGEPGSLPKMLSNCSIQEWQLYGWPATTTPTAASGHLTVTATDVLSGQSLQLLDEAETVEPLTELARQVTLPAHATEGSVRIDAIFTPSSGSAIVSSTNLIFTAPNRKELAQTPKSTMGLLCASGMSALDPFGTGTSKGTDGWTGPDNGVWAATHDLMELGSSSTDDDRRMLTTSTRFCHYTDPWRDMPSGEYYFDDVTDELMKMLDGKLKGSIYIRLFLSDRWNGIPIGAQFTWDDFIRFDEYLRKGGGKGLAGRTRKELATEIRQNHAAEFQVFELNKYADHLLTTQKRFAEKGLDFSVTTHGSFPLVGGEIGQKLAKTHRASGTDVFWELRGEDLFGTLGSRFGLVACNPDFESGMYNEWGWCSGKLNNIHWFSYVGTSEPARRQWYATYFVGRVDSGGEFQPLTMSGADAQGGFGAKVYDNDWQHYYRTSQITSRIRPEAPAGAGLVVSWHEQVRHMGPVAADLGFGYYASAGYENVDKLGGYAYAKLIKAGVPISFLASTDTLTHWKSRQPLIVVDGLSYDKDEIATLQHLHDSGTPIIAIGGASEASPDALKFFGMKKNGDAIEGDIGSRATALNGQTIAYSCGNANNPIIACPMEASAMLDTQAAALVKLIDQPLQLSPGVAATTFISGGQLYLSLSDQGDVDRSIDVSVQPALLAMGKSFSHPRVIDVDNAIELPAKSSDGRLSFSLPCAATDGRMIEITADPQTP